MSTFTKIHETVDEKSPDTNRETTRDMSLEASLESIEKNDGNIKNNDIFSNFSITHILSNDCFPKKGISDNLAILQPQYNDYPAKFTVDSMLNNMFNKNIPFSPIFNHVHSNSSQFYNLQHDSNKSSYNQSARLHHEILQNMKINPYMAAQYILNAYKNKPKKMYFRRAVFTEIQRNGLESVFKKQRYITKCERKVLTKKLELKDSQIKIWFQNRRMKWRTQQSFKNKSNGHLKSNKEDEKKE